MPTPQSLHYDKALTNVAVTLPPGRFSAELLAPAVPVKNISDKFVKYGQEDINANDVKPRAARAQSGEGRWTKTDDTYTCQDYPWKVPVGEDEMRNADSPIDPMARATRVAKNKILLGYEQRMKVIFAAGAPSHATVTAAGAAWSTGTSIFADIDTATEAVEVKSGMAATHLAIPILKARELMRSAEMVKYLQNWDSKTLIDGFMPPVFRGLKVIVLGGRNSTANEGQAVSPARVWNGTTASVLSINPDAGTDGATWCTTFRWSGFAQGGEGVRKWWVEDGRFWYVEYAHYQTEKIVSTECGAQITGI